MLVEGCNLYAGVRFTTRAELAEMLGVSRQRLLQIVAAGHGPYGVTKGRRLIYTDAAIDKWFDTRNARPRQLATVCEESLRAAECWLTREEALSITSAESLKMVEQLTQFVGCTLYHISGVLKALEWFEIYGPKSSMQRLRAIIRDHSMDEEGPLDTPCWIWQRSLDAAGIYGRISCEGEQEYTHRASYRAYNGPIPADKPWVLHKCNNGKCCNPAHLYAGTPLDNTNDRAKAGTGGSGKLCASDKARIIELFESPGFVTKHMQALASELGVTVTNCMRIARDAGAKRHSAQKQPRAASKRPVSDLDTLRAKFNCDAAEELIDGVDTDTYVVDGLVKDCLRTARKRKSQVDQNAVATARKLAAV